MILGAIAAVAGSLATYRYIQIARIPKFVKKARVMKKAIKGGKEIPESALPNSKEDMILKQFSADWENLGLSLGNVLGIREKKLKILPEEEDSNKKKGGMK
jgi:hypothetical protein